MSFAAYSTAAMMRDTVASVARDVLQDERPRYRYATVDSVDVNKRRAMVTFSGELTPVPVRYGALRPQAGALVRVDGLVGDRHVADVVSGNYEAPDLVGYSLTSHNHDGTYSPTGHTHSYVSKSGDTMTGQLIAPSLRASGSGYVDKVVLARDSTTPDWSIGMPYGAFAIYEGGYFRFGIAQDGTAGLNVSGGHNSTYGYGLSVGGRIHTEEYGAQATPSITIGAYDAGIYGGNSYIGFTKSGLWRLLVYDDYVRIRNDIRIVTTSTAYGMLTGGSDYGFVYDSSNKYLALSRGDGQALHVKRRYDGDVVGFWRANSRIGDISVTTSSVTYGTGSDYRMKEDLRPVDEAERLIRDLPVYDFAWKEEYGGGRQHGVLAHEAAEVIPYAVTGEKDAVAEDGTIERQQVDYSQLVPLALAGLQKAFDRIDQLEKKGKK